jgi:hypothetical protein
VKEEGRKRIGSGRRQSGKEKRIGGSIDGGRGRTKGTGADDWQINRHRKGRQRDGWHDWRIEKTEEG